MNWLGLDIGGANLKIADGRGFAVSKLFELWKQPKELAAALRQLLAEAPAADGVATTMTGELADCFSTKADGVKWILDACDDVCDGRPSRVYLTTGEFVSSDIARACPMLAAASNWHVLARFAGRYMSNRGGLLLDIGSTTCDIIPLAAGQPAALGTTDPERLQSGELVYTGVQRSPVCAVVRSLMWRGQACPVAQELFATTWDAYLTLGDLPEESHVSHTADGRPATKFAAHDRLARAICADRSMFDAADARRAAESIAAAQVGLIAASLRRVLDRLPRQLETVVTSGAGEFLARRVLESLNVGARIVSLAEQLGPDLSRCATAHALAVVSRETKTLWLKAF